MPAPPSFLSAVADADLDFWGKGKFFCAGGYSKEGGLGYMLDSNSLNIIFIGPLVPGVGLH